jgi:hypothetical protein
MDRMDSGTVLPFFPAPTGFLSLDRLIGILMKINKKGAWTEWTSRSHSHSQRH